MAYASGITRDDMSNELPELKGWLPLKSKARAQQTPYVALEYDYWQQPRHVCVVQEINCLENEDAEIIVVRPFENELRWMSNVARSIDAVVVRDKTYKSYTQARFIVKARQR